MRFFSLWALVAYMLIPALGCNRPKRLRPPLSPSQMPCSKYLQEHLTANCRSAKDKTALIADNWFSRDVFSVVWGALCISEDLLRNVPFPCGKISRRRQHPCVLLTVSKSLEQIQTSHGFLPQPTNARRHLLWPKQWNLGPRRDAGTKCHKHCKRGRCKHTFHPRRHKSRRMKPHHKSQTS